MTTILFDGFILLGVLFSAAALASLRFGFAPIPGRRAPTDDAARSGPARFTLEVGAIGIVLLAAGIIGLALT